MKGVIIGRNWIKGTVEGHSLYFFFFAISGESTIISKLKWRRRERVGCMEKVTWKYTLPYVN